MAIVCVTAVAGSAVAQQPAPPAPPPNAVDAQVNLSRPVRLSPQDEVSQADVIIKKLDVGASQVRKQLAKAREERDVVKTICLNDKLSQIDVAGRSARERQTALKAAVQRNDAELSDHEFTILSVLRQRGEQLIVEANACIGNELVWTGNTTTNTVIDPDLPGEPTTSYPPVDVIGFTPGPPVCISCFL
jgi:hypothetical protein